MPLSTSQRFQYLMWAATKSVLGRDDRCPSCNSAITRLVRRKYFVTSLWTCDSCGLRFRMPKDDPADTHEFYQQSYREGFTTDCPSETELASLITKRFAGSDKNFRDYIDVLNALGMTNGDSILDFGASWGYGSWQLRQAGFRVFSLEVSKRRAEFARVKLSCIMIEDVECMPERVKCFFAAHVIEHLTNPSLIWEVASKVLSENGLIVSFCPNGEPAREGLVGLQSYDHTWGKSTPW